MINSKRHLWAQKRYFDRHYRTFKEYRLENWRLSFLKRVFENLQIKKGFSQTDDYYLDIGVGASGYTVIEAARFGQTSVGVDASMEAIKRASLFADAQGVRKSTFFVVCSAEHLPFREKTFSKVSLVSVLEHIYNDKLAIEEVSRVAKEKARVFVTVPNTYKRIWPIFWLPYYLADKISGHLRHYAEEEVVSKFKQAGLAVREVTYSAHLIKIVQIFLQSFLGAGKLACRIWWNLERQDLNKKARKTGLQLSAVFERL